MIPLSGLGVALLFLFLRQLCAYPDRAFYLDTLSRGVRVELSEDSFGEDRLLNGFVFADRCFDTEIPELGRILLSYDSDTSVELLYACDVGCLDCRHRSPLGLWNGTYSSPRVNSITYADCSYDPVGFCKIGPGSLYLAPVTDLQVLYPGVYGEVQYMTHDCSGDPGMVIFRTLENGTSTRCVRIDEPGVGAASLIAVTSSPSSSSFDLSSRTSHIYGNPTCSGVEVEAVPEDTSLDIGGESRCYVYSDGEVTKSFRWLFWYNLECGKYTITSEEVCTGRGQCLLSSGVCKCDETRYAGDTCRRDKKTELVVGVSVPVGIVVFLIFCVICGAINFCCVFGFSKYRDSRKTDVQAQLNRPAQEPRFDDGQDAASRLRYDRGLFSIHLNRIQQREAIEGPPGTNLNYFKARWENNDVILMQLRIRRVRQDIVDSVQTEIRQVARLTHPNIRGYLGASYYFPSFGVVYEPAPGGNLHLRIARSEPWPNPRSKMELLRGVVRAMVYMNANGLINCELPPRRIYLSEDLNAQVVTFSTFRALGGSLRAPADMEEGDLSPNLVDRRMMAPEVTLAEDNPTEKADVFCVGILIFMVSYEVLDPYPGEGNDVVFSVANDPSFRPKTPRQVPGVVEKWALKVAARCWKHEPAERPTMQQVLVSFDQHMADQIQIHDLDEDQHIRPEVEDEGEAENEPDRAAVLARVGRLMDEIRQRAPDAVPVQPIPPPIVAPIRREPLIPEPPPPPEPEPEPEFAHGDALQQLLDMGFGERRDEIMGLLLQHNGAIDQVMQALFGA